MELHPNSKTARPSDILQSQRQVIRQQEEVIQVLKGALAAAGVRAAPAHATWMAGLTQQERAMLGMLFSRYPKAARREDILEALPGHDHVKERQLQVVDVVVHKIRKKLGADAVVTERGVGFRMGETFYDQVPKESLQPVPATHAPSEERAFA